MAEVAKSPPEDFFAKKMVHWGDYTPHPFTKKKRQIVFGGFPISILHYYFKFHCIPLQSITFHYILPRFKNVHKRKAEQDRVARINEELDSPTREPSFSDQSFAGGSSSSLALAGGSGVRSRVGFNEEVPSQPKNLRRDAAFSGYQHQQHQQQQNSQTYTTQVYI